MKFDAVIRSGILGVDADRVIWDPARVVTINVTSHCLKVDSNACEGRTVRGAPEHVLLWCVP